MTHLGYAQPFPRPELPSMLHALTPMRNPAITMTPPSTQPRAPRRIHRLTLQLLLTTFVVSLSSCWLVEPEFKMNGKAYPSLANQPDKDKTSDYCGIDEGQQIYFVDASDPQSNVDLREWDVNSDGAWDAAYRDSARFYLTFDQIGWHKIRLRVNEDDEQIVTHWVYVTGTGFGDEPEFRWDADAGALRMTNVFPGDSVWAVGADGAILDASMAARAMRAAGGNLTVHYQLSGQPAESVNVTIPAMERAAPPVVEAPKPAPPPAREAPAKPVRGCMDSKACNYNRKASESDGSCVFADAKACESCRGGRVVLKDKDGDGVCDGDEVRGCRDRKACNYNARATDDDGSCRFPEEGKDCDGNATGASNQTFLTSFKDADFNTSAYFGLITESLTDCSPQVSESGDRFEITITPKENMRLMSLGFVKDPSALGSGMSLTLECTSPGREGPGRLKGDLALTFDANKPVKKELERKLTYPLLKGNTYRLTIKLEDDCRIKYVDASACAMVVGSNFPYATIEFKDNRCPIYNGEFRH